MTYFVFLFAIFAIAASLHERGMPGNALVSIGRVLFGALFMTAWIGLFSLVGYILLG